MSYLDADGKKLYGVSIIRPATKRTEISLITEVYESYFENGFNAGHNIHRAAGYAAFTRP